MLSSHFAHKVLAGAAHGQPAAVNGPIGLEVHLIAAHPAIFNVLFIAIELVLAGLLLWRQTSRAGLKASIVWGLAIWYLGEGFGGLLSGHTSLLVGAPGAALIYVLLAVAALPRKDVTDTKPSYWLPISWCVLWLVGALYQLLPGQNSSTYIAATLRQVPANSPGWLATLHLHVANVVQNTGLWYIFLLALLQALIGLFVLSPSYLKQVAVICGSLLAVAFWVIGQNTGLYFSGLATSPGTGPLVLLLGLVILGCTSLDYNRLKDDILSQLQRVSDGMDRVPSS
jgi:hypothetical protein